MNEEQQIARVRRLEVPTLQFIAALERELAAARLARWRRWRWVLNGLMAASVVLRARIALKLGWL